MPKLLIRLVDFASIVVLNSIKNTSVKMDDMKDKFKGFMKKVNSGLSSSSSGKFKGQGRVLGSSSSSSSSGPANPTLTRPSASSQFVNPNRNPNVNPKPNPSSVCPNSKPSPQKISGRSSFEDKKGPNADRKPIPNRPSSDGFDPFDSLVTAGKRNKNGYSLNVFECPVCNCGFGSEEEVAVHIESCIANPRQSDGDGVVDLAVKDGSEDKDESMNELGTFVGKYLSGNPSEGSVEIVLRLLSNIVKEPENPKFRRIRMGNPKIREAIGEVPGGIELLEGVGFELKEEEGEMWALMDVPSKERLEMLKDSIRLFEGTKNVQSASAIASAKEDVKGEAEKVKKSEPEVVDRQVKVFFSVPESVAARIDLPDSFYNLSLEEVRREAEMRRKKMAESQLLIPKSYREKQAQAARRRYTRTIIRIQFPDGVVLQGVFSPREPTSALYEFVSSALKQQGLEFQLVHSVPVKRRLIPCFPKPGERPSTLDEEDLVPSALVKFKPIETDSIVFTGLTNELLEMSEPLTSGTE